MPVGVIAVMVVVVVITTLAMVVPIMVASMKMVAIVMMVVNGNCSVHGELKSDCKCQLQTFMPKAGLMTV